MTMAVNVSNHSFQLGRMCTQAHAKDLEARSHQASTQPEQVQAKAQAQSFHAMAHSLKKAAEAQNLQVGSCPIAMCLEVYAPCG